MVFFVVVALLEVPGHMYSFQAQDEILAQYIVNVLHPVKDYSLARYLHVDQFLIWSVYKYHLQYVYWPSSRGTVNWIKGLNENTDRESFSI